jgi:hypothetical protein
MLARPGQFNRWLFINRRHLLHGRHFVVYETALVISDVPLEPELGNTARVQQVSLQVFPRENFVNAKDRLTSPATYWTKWVQWSVVLDSSNAHPVPACPLSLISEDGEFLTVLNMHAAGSAGSALRIYRRRDHGVFIKDLTLREIWPADKFPERRNCDR